MRAIFIENFLNENKLVELDKKKTHHFINVLRIKSGERVLILDGKGARAITEFLVENKNKATLKYDRVEVVEENLIHFDIAIGKLKKEALDLSLKMATELGCRKIYVMNTDYSQSYTLNHERAMKLLISSLEQSNNYYLPSLEEVNFKDLDLNIYDRSFSFSLNKTTELTPSKIYNDVSLSKILLIIGPEGGLSESEEDLLSTNLNSIPIKIDSPIMRAPTAMACAMGYVKGSIEALNQI